MTLFLRRKRLPCLYVLDNTPFDIICQSFFYFSVVLEACFYGPKKIDKAPPPLYNMEHEQRRSFSEQESPALKTAVFAFLIYSERKVKDL